MAPSKSGAVPSLVPSASIALAVAAAAAVGCTIYQFTKAQDKYTSKQQGRGLNIIETEEKQAEEESSSIDNNNNYSVNVNVPNSIQLSEANASSVQRIQTPNTITIAYASTTGTCETFAKSLYSALSKLIDSSSPTNVQICTVDELDWWDEILNNETDPDPDNSNNKVNESSSPPILIFILPTWTNGTLPEKYSSLLTSLDEISHDWRVAPKPLRNDPTTAPSDSTSTSTNSRRQRKRKTKHENDKSTIQIASFGMGSTAYDISTFCKPSKDVFKYFMKLGARSLLVSNGRSVVGTADADAGDCDENFRVWMDLVVNRVGDVYDFGGEEADSTCCGGGGNNGGKDESCCKGESQEENNVGCCSNGSNTGGEMPTLNEEFKEILEEEDENDEESYQESDDDDSYDENEEEEPEVMDLEDIGNAMNDAKKKKTTKEVKEMVTPKQAAALKKEGYKIIGSHSAVKLCRWTKHQLRGRGGCYKHTFYGITSYQCMEATPSLACANKCVFCWRHHKNPVGKEWRWKTDDPYEIVDGAVNTHVSMIKEAKGIPGVKMDRWKEAHTVRHCALSLVGEPIMYPRIDELLGELHNRDISTFLVTNGQHPDAIESLRPITQLYVSVDASTPETLEEIDRPLFKDAWQRLRRSLKSLKNKGQRTVARLTVVKGWNSDELQGYAKLIALGHCSLVEVKGVTFCGKSDASNLNMSNSPWHHEVVGFTEKLKEELAKLRAEHMDDSDDLIPEYDLATAHEHSCSVLLARVDQFAVDDPVTGKRKWKTWIDYEKFQELAARNKEDPTFTFGVEDYITDTPDWALFGSEEQGFDPTELRHRRKAKHPKYTKFDGTGIPTHDHEGKLLSSEEKDKLKAMMEEKKKDVGDGASVITLRGGEKKIDDASLMFRGLVIAK